MKRIKMALALFITTSLLVSLSASFAGNRALTLEETITLAKENSAAIRNVENKEFSTQNTIRKNTQNSYQVASSLETFYDYLDDYYAAQDAGHSYNKYLGNSKDQLIKQIGGPDSKNPTDPTKATGLIKEMMIAKGKGQLDKVREIDATIDFVQYYIFFGETDGLTKQTKYEKFKKNEAMLKNSIEMIEIKYEQGLQAAIKGTESGAIKLYVGLKDLEQGLAIQKDMLSVQEEGLSNMNASFEQGLVSRLDYENQIKLVEIKKLEVANLQFSFDNLQYQLKKMCGLPMETTINLSTSFQNDAYLINTPSSYYEQAYLSNMDYNSLIADLNYNNKNFEVMQQYLNEIDNDSKKPVYYQEKVDQQKDIDDLNDQLNNKKHQIESNVSLAYNDVIYKRKLAEYNTSALKLETAKLNKGVQSFKLGQMTQLQLDQLKLQYEGALMTADQNTRSYNTSVENFKLLIDYGVVYTTNQ